MIRGRKIKVRYYATLIVLGILFTYSPTTNAQTANSFSLLVTPSPLIATVKPGETSQLQLKIYNNGTSSESLQILPRGFNVSSAGQINLNKLQVSPIASWVTFSQPKFKLAPGQLVTEQANIAVPKDAGFSYSLVLVINQQPSITTHKSGQSLNGEVAEFMLINVDRPGATRKLEVQSFTVSKHIYQWLPATFTIKFNNTGNTIVQPYGNIFIQRDTNSKTPISTLAVNSGGAYILANTSRYITASWSKGFPVYKTVNTSTGVPSQQLTWNWSDISSFRFGRYTAELVAIYNNGSQEIPIQAEVSFWVIPWEIIVVLVIVAIVILFNLWLIVRTIIRVIKRKSKRGKYRTYKA